MKDTREGNDMSTKSDTKRGGRIAAAVFCFLLAGLLAACTGPVQFAANETEGLKSGYQDPHLASLSEKYAGLLRRIYARYRLNEVRLAKEGLGFTTLTDNAGRKLTYLLVEVRPQDANFDQNKTTGEGRLQVMLQRYFEPNLRMLNKEDVAPDDMDGIAFGMIWPVRDFTQCDTAGGFVEYVIGYIDKEDFFSILDGSETVSSVLSKSEVIVSLDLASPKSIRLRYQDTARP